MWGPSEGLTSKSGFKVHTATLQLAFWHKNDVNRFRGCGWAAVERKGMFPTPIHSTASYMAYLLTGPWMRGIIWVEIFLNVGVDEMHWKHSPDPTLCDFFMWSFTKNKVCHTKIYSLNGLRETTMEALLQLSLVMLGNSWMDLDHCIKIFRSPHGNHVQIYQPYKIKQLS